LIECFCFDANFFHHFSAFCSVHMCWYAQVRPVWLPFLQAPALLSHVLMLVQNTLHSQLLERSLQLLAALLPADDLQQQQARLQRPPEQQQQQRRRQPVYQLLMQAGLMTVVEAVLAPTAEVGPSALEALITSAANGPGVWDGAVYGENPAGDGAAEPANSAAGEEAAAAAAADGGWSEDGADMTADETAADADNVEQRTRELYRSDVILEAVLAVLLQLGCLLESAAAALQQLPDLPELLLHVLAASSLHHKQRVLEALLPVMVVFRHGVLPRIQPVPDHYMLLHMQQQEEVADSDEPPAEQQQQQPDLQQLEAEEEQQQVKGLCLLACIADALQDSHDRPESLDAQDAGWYLLAQATANVQTLEVYLQQQQQRRYEQQQLEQQNNINRQQQQQGGRRQAIILNPASCSFLQQICTRLTRSPAPTSAAAYVTATVHALATCVAQTLSEATHMPGRPEQQQQQQQQQGLLGDPLERMQRSLVEAAAKVTLLTRMVRQLMPPPGAAGPGGI
jgi:hypothetical protein